MLALSVFCFEKLTNLCLRDNNREHTPEVVLTAGIYYIILILSLVSQVFSSLQVFFLYECVCISCISLSCCTVCPSSVPLCCYHKVFEYNTHYETPQRGGSVCRSLLLPACQAQKLTAFSCSVKRPGPLIVAHP